jgi:hypothetical protein
VVAVARQGKGKIEKAWGQSGGEMGWKNSWLEQQKRPSAARPDPDAYTRPTTGRWLIFHASKGRVNFEGIWQVNGKGTINMPPGLLQNHANLSLCEFTSQCERSLLVYRPKQLCKHFWRLGFRALASPSAEACP